MSGVERILRIVNRVRKDVAGTNLDSLPTVVIAIPTLENSTADFVIDRSVVETHDQRRETIPRQMHIASMRTKTEAIANILAAYGLFNYIDADQRASLVKAIFDILIEEGESE